LVPDSTPSSHSQQYQGNEKSIDINGSHLIR
jgi:hypothetical protein